MRVLYLRVACRIFNGCTEYDAFRLRVPTMARAFACSLVGIVSEFLACLGLSFTLWGVFWLLGMVPLIDPRPGVGFLPEYLCTYGILAVVSIVAVMVATRALVLSIRWQTAFEILVIEFSLAFMLAVVMGLPRFLLLKFLLNP